MLKVVRAADYLSVRLAQGYEGERATDPHSKKMAQAKLGLDKNANKKKKKKKVAVVEEGPSKSMKLFGVSPVGLWVG